MNIENLATEKALEQLGTIRSEKEINAIDKVELLSVEAMPSGHAKATFIINGKQDKCVVGGGFDFFNYHHSKREDIKMQAQDNIKLECIRIKYKDLLND